MSTLKLNKTSQCPPDKYRFTHETGYVSRGFDPYGWMEDIKRHRRDNGLPIPPNMQAIAEDQMCRTLPPGWCSWDTGEPSTEYIDVRVTLDEAVNGTLTIGKWILDRGIVEQEVAEERAAICAACPANVGIEGCKSCVSFAEKIAGAIGARKTRADALLEHRSCAWCKCSSKAQVWAPIELLATNVSDELLSRNQFDFCWKARGIRELRAQ